MHDRQNQMLDCHACPAEGCPEIVPRLFLFCRQHWTDLPQPLKNRVNDGWRSVIWSKSYDDYISARQAAIDHFAGVTPAALKLPQD